MIFNFPFKIYTYDTLMVYSSTLKSNAKLLRLSLNELTNIQLLILTIKLTNYWSLWELGCCYLPQFITKKT